MSPGLKCDVVLEQTLGHVTHAQNLRRLLPTVDEFEPTFIDVEFDVSGWPARVPGFGNWTVRAGVRARRAVARTWRQRRSKPDAMFVHTQVPAVLLGPRLTAVPTVVSLDATPQQYDLLGEHYAHRRGSDAVEAVKHRLNRRCFRRARHLVTWAEWTRQGLIDGYGIDPAKITVIPPGVDTARWLPSPDAVERRAAADVVRILFVGGDLRRKGGDVLLDSFVDLRREFGEGVELHLVTPATIDPADGVTAYHAMKPNSAELIELYHRCHVFCLPTLGDCLPMVLPEAGAAGLALISTDVGAIHEIVRDDETGCLVPVGDGAGLTRALRRLVVDDSTRDRLATNCSALVVEHHDAATNAHRIVHLIAQAARSG